MVLRLGKITKPVTTGTLGPRIEYDKAPSLRHTLRFHKEPTLRWTTPFVINLNFIPIPRAHCVWVRVTSNEWNGPGAGQAVVCWRCCPSATRCTRENGVWHWLQLLERRTKVQRGEDDPSRPPFHLLLVSGIHCCLSYSVCVNVY